MNYAKLLACAPLMWLFEFGFLKILGDSQPVLGATVCTGLLIGIIMVVCLTDKR